MFNLWAVMILFLEHEGIQLVYIMFMMHLSNMVDRASSGQWFLLYLFKGTLCSIHMLSSPFCYLISVSFQNNIV